MDLDPERLLLARYRDLDPAKLISGLDPYLKIAYELGFVRIQKIEYQPGIWIRIQNNEYESGLGPDLEK